MLPRGFCEMIGRLRERSSTMELVVEMPGLQSADWYSELLAAAPPQESVELSELRPPAGTLGANFVPRFKVLLTAVGVAADLAGIIGVALALHGGSATSCQVTLTSSSGSIEMTVPCTEEGSPALLTAVSKLVGDDPPSPVNVRIVPNPNPPR
jgi:hypothetical protein